MRGAVPPYTHASPWCGAWLGTGTTLPLADKEILIEILLGNTSYPVGTRVSFPEDKAAGS
jgi:hypothetical protein